MVWLCEILLGLVRADIFVANSENKLPGGISETVLCKVGW